MCEEKFPGKMCKQHHVIDHEFMNYYKFELSNLELCWIIFGFLNLTEKRKKEKRFMVYPKRAQGAA